MPAFLRRDAIRLLDAAAESYLLALGASGLPAVRPSHDGLARFAPLIGLVGTSSELLVKGCLVQALGPTSLTRPDGYFLTGSEAISSLRALIRAADPRSAFLWQNDQDPDATRDSLSDSLARFGLLQTTRAYGFHGGVGVSRDIFIFALNYLYELICTLQRQRRLRPYLLGLPGPPPTVVNRAGVVEDLAARLSGARTLGEKASLLRALTIVLPTIPDLQPDWLDAFERVNVAPREGDLSYLLRTLADAHGIHLVRQRGEGAAFPVAVDNTNADALPISVEFLKRELTKIAEQFHADVGTANGRLSSGILDLPPADFVINLLVLGFVQPGILVDGTQLTAQQAWPFIASALSVQGTQRPYWFIVRSCNELDQLAARLQQAASYGNAYFRQHVRETFAGIGHLQSHTGWDNEEPGNWARAALAKSKAKRVQLVDLAAKQANTERAAPPCLESVLRDISEHRVAVGEGLRILLSQPPDETLVSVTRYWASHLAEAAWEHADVAGLIAVVRDNSLSPVRTQALKALRLVDIAEFGPTL